MLAVWEIIEMCSDTVLGFSGRLMASVVKEKKKAKQPYQKAVSSGQTAGLVKASGRKIEKFSVSVNVAADSSVKFILTHEELLQRHFGKYELMIRVKPNQLVQHFEIVADIYEPQGIAFLDTFGTNELLPLVKKTVTDKKVMIQISLHGWIPIYTSINHYQYTK
ncbi:inter-alpha-trypsin inhibitor heavy chain H3-like [Sinocyclocheilus rhinocerous]|uniref:inter-alpha-trypsin inhibitor heavy chain H3-like n=1 Tax=Sinocyclocheilus rhinocerous TaxID=307959 RepID=UPI0007BA4D40|nr:PREDICTED: inter-alpha-trypsin inhibitor heavy chain H3-like [Sinocyclocheilus rhinocerous]